MEFHGNYHFWYSAGKTMGPKLLVVDSYATTESGKTKGTTGLVYYCENKSLDLTGMGSINTPIQKKPRIKRFWLPQVFGSCSMEANESQ